MRYSLRYLPRDAWRMRPRNTRRADPMRGPVAAGCLIWIVAASRATGNPRMGFPFCAAASDR